MPPIPFSRVPRYFSLAMASRCFVCLRVSLHQAKYKQLLLSLGNVRNDRLAQSVLAGTTTPADLATKVRHEAYGGLSLICPCSLAASMP